MKQKARVREVRLTAVVFAALLFLSGTVVTVLAADGQPSIKAAPRTTNDIATLLSQHQPDQKRAEELRAILNSKPPQTVSDADQTSYHLQRMKAAKEAGALDVRIESARKVVETGPFSTRGFDMGQVIFAEVEGGSSAAALEHIEKVLRYGAMLYGQNVNMRVMQSIAYIDLGDIENASKSLREADQWNNSYRNEYWWPAYRYTYEKLIEVARARILTMQGKYAEAEAAMRKSVDAAIADIATIPMKSVKDEKFVYEHSVNTRLADLAGVLAMQGRLNEAEFTARRALNDTVSRFGGYSFQTAYILTALIQILQQQGRYAEAVSLAKTTIDIFTKSGAVDDAKYLVYTRNLLASALVAQGNYADALAEYHRIHASFAAYPESQGRLAAGNADWALALVQTGKPDEALPMLDRIIARNAMWLGKAHGEIAIMTGVKGMALVASGQKDAAFAQFRMAMPILLNEIVSPSDEVSPMRAQRLKTIMEAYLSLLGESQGTPLEQSTGVDIASDAFKIADALRGQNTQQAVAASAARAVADDPQLGGVIRKEQDLRQEVVSLHQILRDLMLARREQQLPKVIADMQSRIATIKQEQIALQAEIEKRFPAYANLIRPQPPTLAQARAVLRSGESMVTLYAADSGTYVWAFKKDGPIAFVSIKMKRTEVEQLVQKLRKALDPGNVDVTNLPVFDLAAAQRLYAELLVPVASGWQGANSLLVVANGALSQLPFAVLPTGASTVKPNPKILYAELQSIPWLIQKTAITQLPSANALVALRKLPVANGQRAPFVGFGDPQFSMVTAMSTTGTVRNLAIPRLSQRKVAQGESMDWIQYSQIPPLPDTRDEILALAKALKADPDRDIFLGTQASKANIMRTDLAKYKIVAFATHGLLPGDFPGVDQPSLAMANPNDGNHGLLTLDDILKLKLDADWVVLSACNTAAGDGAGSDAVSGLGRGFFYAGTRALLATHWPVESLSARFLVTGIFERQATNPTLTRAEALRQSMLGLMQQTEMAVAGQKAYSYAHPLFWAPYALIGDSGAN